MGAKGSQGGTTTTENKASPEAMALYRKILKQAEGVAATPFTAYTGELVAPLTEQQRLGISGINAGAGFASPYIQNAAQMTQAASAPITAEQIQQYMNPFTHNVVDATQAQFANQNARQQQQVLGNAIAQGALGGNRSAIAQAETAHQQQLAQAPVIANLMSQGYTQGLSTALAQQQAQMAGAQQLGGLGIAGQQAALAGAGAQFGAGTQEQQTQQALDAAQYQQFQTKQAYPFQTLQWLAGLGTGVGSQMGGTSVATQEAAQPSTSSQVLGGIGSAVGLLAMFSDKNVKENIKRVGKTNDGQHIYLYNYKGDPTPRIGLMAQEVERVHPEAVTEINGIKAVDYKEATKDAVERGRGGVVYREAGGPVSPNPYSAGVGWIPQGSIAHGSGAPRAAPPPSETSRQPDFAEQAKKLGALAKEGYDKFKKGKTETGAKPDADASGNPVSLAPPQASSQASPWENIQALWKRVAPSAPVATAPPVISAAPAPMMDGVAAPMNLTALSPGFSSDNAIFRRGGAVKGYAYGGTTEDDGITGDDDIDEIENYLDQDLNYGVAPTPNVARQWENSAQGQEYSLGDNVSASELEQANLTLNDGLVPKLSNEEAAPPVSTPPSTPPSNKGVAGADVWETGAEPVPLFGKKSLDTLLPQGVAEAPMMPIPSTVEAAGTATLGKPSEGVAGASSSLGVGTTPANIYAEPAPGKPLQPSLEETHAANDYLKRPEGVAQDEQEEYKLPKPAAQGMDIPQGVPKQEPISLTPKNVVTSRQPASIVDKIHMVESGGNPRASNPRSTAFGKGQFIDSTWLSTIRMHRPDLAAGRSPREIIALKYDTSPTGLALQDEMTGALAQDNANYLKSRGLPVTAGTQYLAHFAGPNGAAAILAADDRAPISSVMTPAAIAANPFLQGKTVGHVKRWAENKMSSAESKLVRRSGEAPVRLASNEGVVTSDAGPQYSVPSQEGVAPREVEAPGKKEIPSEEESPSEGVVPKIFSRLFPNADLSPTSKLWPALTAAGFSMMASRAPNLGASIGEAGMVGLQTYAAQKEHEQKYGLEQRKLQQEQAKEQQRQAFEQQKLDFEQHKPVSVPFGGTMIDPVTRQPVFTSAGAATKGLPLGYQRNTEGGLEPIPGGPKDPEVIKNVAAAKAKQVDQGELLNDETLTALAQQYRAGDLSVFTNLGRGAQGAKNIVALRTRIAEQNKALGVSGEEQALKMAEYGGLKAAEKVTGTKVAAIALPAEELKLTLPLAVEASEKVDRTIFPSLNEVLLAYKRGTGDEDVAVLGQMTNSLVNIYGRAINPSGVATVSDKEHAREMLFDAYAKGQYRAVAQQMLREVETIQAAPEAVKEELRKGFLGPLYKPRKTSEAPVHPAQIKVRIPSETDIETLRARPKTADIFDKNFGVGAAEKILKGAPTSTASTEKSITPSVQPEKVASSLAEAKAAIARGVPRDAIIQRLRAAGIEPVGI